jgi:hypothetical protein
VLHHQFDIQQLYILLTLYWFVLCLSENKQRIVPLTTETDCFYNWDGKYLQRGTDWGLNKAVCASSLKG